MVWILSNNNFANYTTKCLKRFNHFTVFSWSVLKMTFNGVMSLTFSPKIQVSNGALKGVSLVIRWSRGKVFGSFLVFGQLSFWQSLEFFYSFLRCMSVEYWKWYRKNRYINRQYKGWSISGHVYILNYSDLPDHILTLKMAILYILSFDLEKVKIILQTCSSY